MISALLAWARARFSASPIDLALILAMHSRNSPVPLIVDCHITAQSGGESITFQELEAHFLAGGTVEYLVLAMIAARQVGQPIPLKDACELNLTLRSREPSESLLTRTRELIVADRFSVETLRSSIENDS